MFKRRDSGGAGDGPGQGGGSGGGRTGAARNDAAPAAVAPKTLGDRAEDRALAYLQRQGLTLLQRNYRLAGGPYQHGAEIDLILSDRDGTLVFVEVRSRRAGGFGGAAASIDGAKQRRLVRAARHYLMRLASPPPCRFDVVALDGGEITWLRAAFDA